MSDNDVYENDMPDSAILERDIEQLLSGELPENPDLAQLAPVVARTRAAFSFVSLEESVASFGIEAARIADATRPTPPVREVSRSGWSTGPLRRRLVLPVASAGLFIALSGVAIAANGSAPGDGLYGFDRALEVVGIGNGGAAERIAEAQALFADGLVAEAVAHVAETAVGTPEAAAAADALLKAAEQIRVNEPGGDTAIETRERVADMLEWMATTDASGKEFGEGVADRAGGLTPEQSPGEGAGQPEEPGAQGGGGQPVDPGAQGENPPGGGQGNQGGRP